MGTSHEDVCTFIAAGWILLKMRNVSDKMVEKIKTHILWSITFSQNWDTVEKYDTVRQAIHDNIIWHMHFVYWIIMAIDKHNM
jgi:hypothetical protein